MNRLRQVLGDSADQPRYIETLPGRGYRFIAPVQESVKRPALVMPTAPLVMEVEQAAAAPPLSGRTAREDLATVDYCGLHYCQPGGRLPDNQPAAGQFTRSDDSFEGLAAWRLCPRGRQQSSIVRAFDHSAAEFGKDHSLG
jgi:hypothetical protein